MTDLDAKMAAAARCDGWLGDLTDVQARLLHDRGHAQHVATTGRWVLTDAGRQAADRLAGENNEQEN